MKFLTYGHFAVFLLLTALCSPFSIRAKEAATPISPLYTSPCAFEILLQNLQATPENYEAYHRIYQHLAISGRTEQAAVFRQVGKTNVGRQYALWMQARLKALNGKSAAALRDYRKALAIRKPPYELSAEYVELSHAEGWEFLPLPSPEDTSAVLFARAYACFLDGAFRKADSLFRCIDDPNAWEILHYHGRNLIFLDRDESADSLFRKGFQWAHNTDNPRLQALFALDCFYTSRQDEEAFWLAAAQQAAEAACDPEMTAKIKKYQAYLERRQGHHDCALKLLDEAIQIAKQLGKNWELAELLLQKAETHYRIYQISEALTAAEQSRRLSQRIKDRYHQAGAEEMRGKIYEFFQLYDLAELHYKRALEIVAQIDASQKTARLRRALRSLELQRSANDRVISTFSNLLREKPSPQNSNAIITGLLELGRAYLLDGKADSSLLAYERALAAAKDFGSANQQAWATAGSALARFARGDTAAAVPLALQVLKDAEILRSPQLALMMYAELGHFKRRAGNDSAAVAFYRRALELVESFRESLLAEQLRQEFLSSGRWRIYESLLESLARRFLETGEYNLLDEIYQIFELMLARALKDRLNSAERSPQISAEEEYYRNICRLFTATQTALRHASADSVHEVNRLLNELDEQKRLLLSARIEAENRIRTLGQPRRQLTLAEVRSRLSNQTLVLYYLGDDLSFALAVQADKAALLPLPINRRMAAARRDSLLRPFYAADEQNLPQLPFNAGAAYRFYRDLLQPVNTAFPRATNFVIIPCSEQAALPFELLLTRLPQKELFSPCDEPEYADAFAVNRFVFSYAPSATFLQHSCRMPRSRKAMIVANPLEKGSADDADLRAASYAASPLPFAVKEGMAVKKLLPKAVVLKETKASETEVKRSVGDCAVIHFATHAFFDPTSEAFSGLLLASSSIDDGLLMGYEILDLPLCSDLVVLSACESGKGTIIRG
ncbi:MAG: CHAT domain-containing protein, partial [candidate division KSB1 bacterium]|nr:CHAT domain-containing protein [candidate division KSB1 bacterium]